MLQDIRRWLASPVFEDDEEKTRRARVLNTVLVVCLCVVLGAVVAIPFIDDPVQGVVPILGMSSLSLGALVLLRLGYVNPAGILFSAAIWNGRLRI